MFIKRFMTNGHAADIPYRTTLNAELRNPEQANQIRAVASLERSAIDAVKINDRRDYFCVHSENSITLKDKLNAEFKKLFPTLSTKTRYRGCNISDDVYEKLSSAKIGDIIVPDEGFAYYSGNKEVAKGFAKGKNPVLITCKIPFWSKVSRMIIPLPEVQQNAIFLKWKEVMVPAGSKYKLLSRNIDANGILNLGLKLLRK